MFPERQERYVDVKGVTENNKLSPNYLLTEQQFLDMEADVHDQEGLAGLDQTVVVVLTSERGDREYIDILYKLGVEPIEIFRLS